MSLQSVVACRSVKDFSDPALDLIERTYTESFPEVERRDFSLVRNLVRDESRFIVYALSKEDRYVGFITGWLFDGYTYVEHFAIDPAARNGGIGAEAMKQFLVFCGTPVVLEVEMPTDGMSKRRIGFYERLGFKLDNQVYHQPPYREGGEWLEMLAYRTKKAYVFHRVERYLRWPSCTALAWKRLGSHGAELE